jgi:hypothetical protein
LKQGEKDATLQQIEDELSRADFFSKKMIDGVHYIDYSTRVIFISFNCYEPSQDRFITTQMIFEFTLAGMIKTHPIKIICFCLDELK